MAKPKITLPKISSYEGGTDNAHALRIAFADFSLYFSYQTLVAFYTIRTGMVIRENAWGPTTGKHLKAIDPDKRRRVSKEKFESLWQAHVASRLSGRPNSTDVKL